MDLREARLRISPWLALVLAAMFLLAAVISKRSAITFHDLKPGLGLLGAAALLFLIVRKGTV